MSEQGTLDLYAGPSPMLKDRLVALARELLQRAGAHGCGFDDVRIAAETRGWLTGEERGRWLSVGDAIMRTARGKRGQVIGYRRTKHRNGHRRRIAVHVHQDYAPQRQESAA